MKRSLIFIVVLLAAYLVSGFYIVQGNQNAVVRRFGRLVTTDCAMAVFVTFSVYYLWRYDKTSQRGFILLSSLALALALLSKYTAGIFVPVLAVLLGIVVSRKRERGFVRLGAIQRLPAFWRALVDYVAILALAAASLVLIVYLVYGFQAGALSAYYDGAMRLLKMSQRTTGRVFLLGEFFVKDFDDC